MGRLIDADLLREEVNSWGMNDYEPSDFTDAIDDAPPVEAIPKDQYEARLKADMVAMLKEIQLEIEEIETYENTFGSELRPKKADKIQKECLDLIQQKINVLKENKDNE